MTCTKPIGLKCKVCGHCIIPAIIYGHKTWEQIQWKGQY